MFLRIKKYTYAPLNENEGQICLKLVKTMTCSRFEEVHLQCTALWLIIEPISVELSSSYWEYE